MMHACMQIAASKDTPARWGPSTGSRPAMPTRLQLPWPQPAGPIRDVICCPPVPQQMEIHVPKTIREALEKI